jgi:hypothetical protein
MPNNGASTLGERAKISSAALAKAQFGEQKTAKNAPNRCGGHPRGTKMSGRRWSLLIYAASHA